MSRNTRPFELRTYVWQKSNGDGGVGGVEKGPLCGRLGVTAMQVQPVGGGQMQNCRRLGFAQVDGRVQCPPDLEGDRQVGVGVLARVGHVVGSQ